MALGPTNSAKGARYWFKRENFEKVREIIGIEIVEIGEIKRALLNQWQEEWNHTEKGRRTYEIFPNIRQSLRLKHLQPSQGLTHYLTGHGPYGVYLHRIHSRITDLCDSCRVCDSPEHALFECDRSRELCVDE